MNPARGSSAGSYARAIEGRWSQLLERPVVLSPREWALLSDWHARGIPLELVGEAIDELSEPRRRRRRGAPRSLSAIARSVEEAWSVVRGDRSDPPDEGARAAEPRPAVTVWEARCKAEPEGSLLRRRLEELLKRLDGGEPAHEVDRRLDGMLSKLVPAGALRQLEEVVRGELAPFRGRMSDATFAATFESARAERLRRELGLPRLAFDAVPARE